MRMRIHEQLEIAFQDFSRFLRSFCTTEMQKKTLQMTRRRGHGRRLRPRVIRSDLSSFLVTAQELI